MTDASLSIASVVQVRQGGVRSVNVERDLQQTSVAEGYSLTVQARRSLERMLDRLDNSTISRAWTLTGPYGSGKSYFGLFLMNLMAAGLPAHDLVVEQLREIDPLLAQRAVSTAHSTETRGFLPVPVMGYRGSLQQCLAQGLRRALEPLSHHAEIADLLASQAAWPPETESRVLVDWLRSLLSRIPSTGYRGVLLVVDEMGKLLEYCSAHPDKSDIFLLQELAELANRSGETPLVMIGILHQGFDRYAGNLDSISQREWAKVQGRFEDIAFQEPPGQQMWLLANALEPVNREALQTVRPLLDRYAQEALLAGWRPSTLSEQQFVELCQQAYPFHPAALVALPYVFRKLAQNERSLFAYLTSLEPNGFREYIETHELPSVIGLPDLFDYLVANFQGRLYGSARARSLTETLERLDSAHDLPPLTVDALKTIGTLNWLAEISHVQATEDNMLFALRRPECDDEAIRGALELLRSRSLIVFRRYNRTFAVWEGSDVDIDERLTEASKHAGGTFSIAAAIQQYLPPQPVVARRHSFQTGTQRFFDVRYIDTVNLDQVQLAASPGSSGTVLLCLPANAADARQFVAWTSRPAVQDRTDLVVGIMERTTRLADLLIELRNLHWIKDNTPELRDDPIARRELRSRVGAIEALIRADLEHFLSVQRMGDDAGCRWFYQGRDATTETARGLSHLLSQVSDALYHASPRLRNELINRRTLSSQGAAARRNLIEAMLTRSDQPQLGIQGYPPERSMYESLLKATGLHQQGPDGVWRLSAPFDDDPSQLLPAWRALADYVFSDHPEPRPVDALFELLKAPPYGLTDGVLPALLCAFAQVHRDETTLYQQGTLLPEPVVADWEVLIRRPELFAVAGCRVVGARAVVIERLARGLDVQPTALSVVRDLIRRLKTLPEHAWRTQRLSPTTLKARHAIERAQSPEALLLQELPQIFGVAPFAASEAVQPAEVERFFQGLNATLQELNDATPRLMLEARNQLLTACGLPADDAGWQQFLGLAIELAPKVRQSALAPLLKRAAEAPDAKLALESALAYAASRPVRNWTDSDSDRFVEQAQSLGGLFKQERNGRDPEADLSAEQKMRSRRIVESLKGFLETNDDDPEVVRAALSSLLREY